MEIQRVVMTGPRAVEVVRETLEDAPLAAHEVVLRTHYSLISPGTELAHYTGTSDLGRHIAATPTRGFRATRPSARSWPRARTPVSPRVTWS